MFHKRKVRSKVIKASDFILGFILGLLALAVGRHAAADTIDTYVNSNIKEEYIRMEIEKHNASLDYGQFAKIKNSNAPEALPSQPVGQSNSLINHADDISNNEQVNYTGNLERPQVGVSQKYDPNDNIENKIADEQAYELYREHYRGAVQKEFVRRVKAAGLNPGAATAAGLYRSNSGFQQN